MYKIGGPKIVGRLQVQKTLMKKLTIKKVGSVLVNYFRTPPPTYQFCTKLLSQQFSISIYLGLGGLSY